MSAFPDITLLTAAQLHSRQMELVELLRNAVNGGASVSFIAPLDVSTAETYWSKIVREVEQGLRLVLAVEVEGRIVGSAQLALATTPNGKHRAEVQKMLVHSDFRRRGIAVKLLEELDKTARNVGRTLLVLDTEEGSAGEALYTKYGYVRVGSIPEFAFDSTGSRLIATIFFYRLLS